MLVKENVAGYKHNKNDQVEFVMVKKVMDKMYYLTGRLNKQEEGGGRFHQIRDSSQAT